MKENDLFEKINRLKEKAIPKDLPFADTEPDDFDDFYDNHKGRITGSMYDRCLGVITNEVRSPKELSSDRLKKQDKIDFIVKCGLEHQLDVIKSQNEGKLLVKDIDPIYYSIEPTIKRELTKGALTELSILIGEWDIQGRNRAKGFDSAATRHGKQVEAQGLDEFEVWYKQNVADDVVFDRPTEIIEHPTQRLWGSTPDMTIRKNYQTYITEVVELKSPWNLGNHYSKVVKPAYLELIGEKADEFEVNDKRYTKQLLGYFHNIPTLERVWFVSYEPQAGKIKQIVQKIERKQVQGLLTEFEDDLTYFTNTYIALTKKLLGLDLTDDSFFDQNLQVQ